MLLFHQPQVERSEVILPDLLTPRLWFVNCMRRFMFDEPSSYLDVKQRLRAAVAIRNLLAANKYIIVVEHDLSVLDYMSDFICCLYGVPGAYGVVTMPFSVREGLFSSTLFLLFIVDDQCSCLQCFDAVGWVAGRASGL